MNEPLMSTPMKRTRRPGWGAWAFEVLGNPGRSAATRVGARRAAMRTATEMMRMSGRLPGARVAQLHDQRSRVLEVPYRLKRQLEEVPIPDQERDEVDCRRDDLHRGHEERVEEAFPLRAHPVKLLAELTGKALREEPERGLDLTRRVPIAYPLPLDDRHHRGGPGGGEEEPGQAAKPEPRDPGDRQGADDP